MVGLFANSGDTDQTLHSAASDLGPHCSPTTLFGVSRLQWVKPQLKQTSDTNFKVTDYSIPNTLYHLLQRHFVFTAGSSSIYFS